ncbi:MAG: hypothetical protein ACXVX8_05965 [Blastococcus sp.]
MILTAIGTWFLLSVLMTVACAAVVRGGVREDMMRGYVTDRM